MRLDWRGVELRLLLPVALLVPLGFAVTHIAMTGEADPGDLGLAIGYVVLVLLAHLALVAFRHRGDQLLLPAVAAMGGIGLIMLNRMPQGLAGTRAFDLELGMAPTQLLWFAVGIAVAVGLAVGVRDDRLLRHYKYSWAAAGVLLLVATFLFGYEVNGARLWINVGPVSVQPGEAIKLILVVFIAAYLAETRALLTGASSRLIGRIRIPPLPYFLPMLALLAIVMLIVVRLNDLGTALLFFGTFLTMLFVATGRRSYVLIGLVLFVAASFVAYRLFGHVAVRVDNWIDPFADPSGAGFQTVRALYALGRGGLFGEGLGQGFLERGDLTIPFVHTDFIFVAVAEELGLLGAVALLGFAAIVVFRGLRVAAMARDDFSAMLAAGLTASLGLQTLIIAAGNTKLVPLTGITFPFVSYGGSSLVASFAMVGLLLSISHRSVPAEVAPTGGDRER